MRARKRVDGLVTQRKVSKTKIAFARALRRHMTPEEQLLWQHLRNNQLGRFHFRRQQIIAGYIVDFYCHQAAVVVELEGEIHDYRVAQDRERLEAIRANGLHVLTFQNHEVQRDIEGVLYQIKTACIQRTTSEPFATDE